LPSVDPNAEGEDVVNPFFWVTIVIVFARYGFTPGEAIGALMLVCGNMNELKVEE